MLNSSIKLPPLVGYLFAETSEPRLSRALGDHPRELMIDDASHVAKQLRDFASPFLVTNAHPVLSPLVNNNAVMPLEDTSLLLVSENFFEDLNVGWAGHSSSFSFGTIRNIFEKSNPRGMCWFCQSVALRQRAAKCLASSTHFFGGISSSMIP